MLKMNRKLKFSWIAFAAVLVLSVGLAVASIQTIPNQANGKALGLNKIVFIHYREGFGKDKPCDNDGVCDPDEKGWCNDCKGGGGDEEEETECYDFLHNSKPRWQWTEGYYYAEGAGLSSDFVGDTLATSTETWDKEVAFNIFGSENYGNYPWGEYDYHNAISFGDYDKEGVIAVTAIWYQGKKIYEYDILFDTDFTWGDATDDPSVMDFQNIATHELGHGAGMNDLYDTVCSEETMYGYSEEGEIKKRSLEVGDITGVSELYS